MAKKKRKKSQRRAKTSTTANVSPVEAQSINRQRRAVNNEEFDPDYTPIIRDLKRIGMLAVGFFVVLVVLSFIL